MRPQRSKKSVEISRKKNNGDHFTPPNLARFIARRIVAHCDFQNLPSIKILDPACGDGELLVAICEEIPTAYLHKVSIVGIEQSATYAQNARSRLSNANVHSVTIEVTDFLQFVLTQNSQLSLFDNEHVSLTSNAHTKADIVIANPPYVRTQNIGAMRSKELSQVFHIEGRIDLYCAFLTAITMSVRQGGIVGTITSNRFLSTKSGISIRKLLATSYNIRELFDLVVRSDRE